MAKGTTPRPSELIRIGVTQFPDTGVVFSGLYKQDSSGLITHISALGALYAGAGYYLRRFDQNLANNALFDGYRAWVSGLKQELPLADAVSDLMAHEKWTPEDVARYLERNLGL